MKFDSTGGSERPGSRTVHAGFGNTRDLVVFFKRLSLI